MCVSVDEAEFSGTILYTGRRHHPEHGLINVLGYQNTAVNLAIGPNAMLLHVPARQTMTPENFVGVGRHDDVLTRMVDAVAPVAAAADSTDWMESGAQRAVQVFEHDIYTVLLAADPTLLPTALGRVPVPVHKRPRLSAELMEFYADLYQRHTIIRFLRGYPGLEAGEESGPCGAGQG